MLILGLGPVLTRGCQDMQNKEKLEDMMMPV